MEVAFLHLCINYGMDLTFHFDWIFYPDWPAEYSNTSLHVSSPNTSINVFYRLYLHLTNNATLERLPPSQQPTNIKGKQEN